MDPRDPWLWPRPRPPSQPPLDSFNSSPAIPNYHHRPLGINSVNQPFSSPADFSYLQNLPPIHPPVQPPVPLPQPVGTDSLNQSSSSALRPFKRKRGRPSKLAPDRGIILDPLPKRPRGRPPGATTKQTIFTPRRILLEAGEDVAAKIWSFCEEGPRASSVSILSAYGTVSMAHIRLLTSAGGTAHLELEGLYTILSLQGTCSPSEDGGYGTSGLTITLLRNDGSIVGGSVSGKLIAASQIQLLLGTYCMDGNQKSRSKGKSGPSSSVTPPNAPPSVTSTSATSHGASSRYSSYVDPHDPGNGTEYGYEDGIEYGSGDESGS